MKLLQTVIALIFSMAIVFNGFGNSNAMENMANSQMPSSCKAMCDADPIGNACCGCLMDQ